MPNPSRQSIFHEDDEDDFDFRPRCAPSPRYPAPSPNVGAAVHPATTSGAKPNPTTKTKGAGAAQAQQEKQERQQARSQKRAQKEAELHAKRQRRVEDAFASHASSSSGRRDAVQILVSESLFNDTSNNDVLKHIRPAFPDQVISVARSISNVITWQYITSARLDDSRSPPQDANLCVFVFHAEQYLQHMDYLTLDDCVRSIKREYGVANRRIIFLICGMDLACKRILRKYVRAGSESTIVDKRAVQDSYVQIYMDYDVHVQDMANVDDLSEYLLDLTEAVAVAPYRQEQDMLSASLRFRQARSRTADRTAVVSNPAANNDGCSSDDGTGYDLQKKKAVVHIEREHDLGNLYLMMLCLIPRVSAAKAKSVREKYPTLRVLLDAYDECHSARQRDLLLAELRYGNTNRQIGPSVSKTIADVFNSLDENANV